MELEDGYGIRIAEDEAERIKTVGQAVDFVLTHVSGHLDVLNGPAKKLLPLFDKLPESLAQQAFSHSSWVEDRSRSYERLAFLGDSVLNIAVSRELFPRFERSSAGRLTKIRAQTVSRRSCVEVARALGRPRPDSGRGPGGLRAAGRAAGRVGQRAGGGGRGRHRRLLSRVRLRADRGRGRGGVRAADRVRDRATCPTSRASCRSGSRSAGSSWSTAS